MKQRQNGRGHPEPNGGVDQHERHFVQSSHHRRDQLHTEKQERSREGNGQGGNRQSGRSGRKVRYGTLKLLHGRAPKTFTSSEKAFRENKFRQHKNFLMEVPLDLKVNPPSKEQPVINVS